MRTRQLTDAEFREHHKTRGQTAYLRKLGELWPKPCEVCGAEPAECHHIDYSDPERVMWLCKAHHKQTHSQFARPAPLFWDMDIRAAQRRIDAQRLALRARRALKEGGPPALNGISRGALPPFGTPETALPPPQVLPLISLISSSDNAQ